jgi:hypothetical protein
MTGVRLYRSRRGLAQLEEFVEVVNWTGLQRFGLVASSTRRLSRFKTAS